MAGIKALLEMAKAGEISKKLLENESFKSELKTILKKEENIEITDEQISEAIKSLEIALQNEEILKKVGVADVSGGKSIKSRMVKGITTLLGAAIGFHGGAKISGKFNVEVTNKILNKHMPNTAARPQNSSDAISQILNDVASGVAVGMGVTLGSAAVGAAGGGYGGYKVGQLVCEKLDIK